MKFEEAVEVLQTIRDLYPRHGEITHRKTKALVPLLEKMDFDAVMKKLSAHAAKHPFAPTISEIAVYLPEGNEHLSKMQRWEQEAADVPRETREEFLSRLQELMRSMADDSK